MTTQWFISDLHLATERPHTIDLFASFMRDAISPGDRVFILGDLFDVWIGDDDDGPLAERVREILSSTTERDIEVAIQRGNRDFLMGKRLMAATGAQLLPDCYVTRVGGKDTLLMHGDLLCTDDVDYQKARRRFRNPLFQWLMLRRSLAARRRIAADYRRRSGEATAAKTSEIMDVNAQTVGEYLKRFDVHQLIHGHTHRPAIHQHAMPDGSHATRLVLPEWHRDHAVAWRDHGGKLEPLDIR
jgi:UDP-2,3-diacylglucosamine hydrolase